MSKKSLTKDCPSCELLFIDDLGQFICNWGKSKKRKILQDANATKKFKKKCTLKR